MTKLRAPVLLAYHHILPIRSLGLVPRRDLIFSVLQRQQIPRAAVTELRDFQIRVRLRSPWLEFTPAVGPAGACFYRGQAFPELTGKLLVGCLRGEGILSIGLDGTNAVSCERLLHFKFGRIREVTEGPDGFIYFTTSQFDPPEGTPRPDYDYILRLVPKDAPATGARIAEAWKGPRPQEMAFDPATTNASQIIPIFCAACHGPGLRGGMQRGLLYGKWQFAKDDDGLRKVITGGIGDKGMPAFGNAIKSEQVTALLQYIRQNQTNGPEPTLSVPANRGEFE